MAYGVKVSFKKNNGELVDVGDYSTKGLMNYLVDKTKLAGHQISFMEAKEDPDMIQPNNFAWYFGSFDEAARAAWDKVRTEKDKEEKKAEEERNAFWNNLPETKKRNRKDLKGADERVGRKNNHRGKMPQYSVEELKMKLRLFYMRNDRLPKQADVGFNSGLPSYVTLVKYLGPPSGWEKIVHAMDTNDKNQEKPAEKADGKSSIEELEKTEDFFGDELQAGCSVDGDICGEVTEGSSTEEAEKSLDVTNHDTTEEETGSTVDDDETRGGTAEAVESEVNGKDLTWEVDRSCMQRSDEVVEVETRKAEHADTVKIEMKISVPDREKPIFITLSV